MVIQMIRRDVVGLEFSEGVKNGNQK